MSTQHTPTVRVFKAFNSASQFTVSADGTYLGTVYVPRGRKWGTVMETGHPVWQDEVARCLGLENGTQILVDRFMSGVSPVAKGEAA